MNEDTLNLTYEAITNPILRILIYCLLAAIASLAGVIVFLYRDGRSTQRLIVEMNQESIEGYGSVADAMEDLQRELELVQDTLKSIKP